MIEKLLLKPAEVAELLGIGRTRAYELISCGQLPTVSVGSSVRVPAEALREWVRENTARSGGVSLEAGEGRPGPHQ